MSEEKMEHSPLPWGEHLVDEVQVVSRVGEGEEVCAASGDYDHDYERMYANARFIVTACNSYYDNKAAIAELVGALEEVIRSAEATALRYGTALRYEIHQKMINIIAKHKAGA